MTTQITEPTAPTTETAPTKTAKPKTKTAKPKTDYSPVTAGDKSYPFTASVQKIFNANYPGLLQLITGTGYTTGREFGLYFRHTVTTETGKKSDIITFIKTTGTKKNLAVPKPTETKFNSKTFKKHYPKLHAYLSKFDNVIFILTYFGRRDYRAIHYSYKF